MGLIKFFVEKSLSVLRLGRKWLQKLLTRLGAAAFGNTYVETVAPSQADTFHKEIKRSDFQIFKKFFELCTRFTVKRNRLKNVEVAVDVTYDLYWGKGNTLYTRSTQDNKDQESWQWVTLAIVKPKYIPLMSLPYRQTDDLDEIVIELLEYLETFKLKVDLVLFDRGFFHWNLIDFLNGYRRGWKWPYLIFVPKNKAIKKYIQQTKRNYAVYIHQKKYSKDKTRWFPKTKIVIFKGATKNKKGKLVDWSFATNLKDTTDILQRYRKRWNIETGFRVHDEAKIKTKSTVPIIRYFYHIMSFVFMMEWINKKKKKIQIPFKKFLYKQQKRRFYFKTIHRPP